MMMGRGADGGRVAEGIQKLEIDIFTQALKALALNHPFDLDDGVGAGSDAAGPSQPLSRYSGAGDGRRKHKKIQGRGQDGSLSGAKIGSSMKSRDGKFSKLWLEMEEYFRSVTSEDVMALAPNTQIDISNIAEVSDPCLLIPPNGIYGRETQQDGMSVTQNLSCAATLQVMDKKETEHCGADVKQDNKHSPSGQAVDGCVQEDVVEGGDWVGTEGDRAALVSSKQETSSGLITPTGGIYQNVSTSVLPNRESVTGPYLTEILSMEQELNLGSPKLGMNAGTNMARVSVPVHELSSCTKLEGAVDPNWEGSSSAELRPVVSPELESCSGEKPAALALHHRQESNFGAKSVMVTSNQQESNSIAKLSLASSTKQEPSCGAKRKLLAATSLRCKKRKLSDFTAEVLTTFISPPENGEEDLCHVCYGGDSEDWNQILFCDTCDVAVHQECYGVQQVPDGQWLCSWCSYRSQSKRKVSGRSGNDYVSHKQSNNRVVDDARPCVLCPRNGGALKPVARTGSGRENNGCLQFAHLFCCQWVPETYIENTETMEPIKNIEGIKEERWKLICSLCKEKHGACIQCSHGMCATAFHPLCARDLKLQMGISSKEGSDDVGLWAFCSKHSLTRVGRASLLTNGTTDGLSEAEGMPSGENVTSHTPDEVCLEQKNELSPTACACQPTCIEISSKEVTNQAMPDQVELLENCEGAMLDQVDLLENCEGIKTKASEVDNAVHPCYASMRLLSGNSKTMPQLDKKHVKTGDLQGVSSAVERSAVLEMGNSENSASIPSSKSKENTLAVEVDDDVDCIEILRKAVHKRQFILKDVANQMGVSLNLLTSLIKGDKHNIPIDLQKKVSGWLCNLSSQINTSQPATEKDNFFNAKAYHQDDLARDYVQTGKPSKKTKNKKKLLKVAGCSKGECMLSEMQSSVHSDRAGNDLGRGEKCYRQSEYCYNEVHLGIQSVKDSDQNKSFMKVDDAESMDEFKARRGHNNYNLVLKDFDEERQEQEMQQQARPMATELKHNLAGFPTETEDVPAGVSNSAVEKHSNSKHASFKIQAMKVSDGMELAQSGNNETDCGKISLKGCSAREELDALMERYNAGSNLVGDQAENCNVDGVPAETIMKCVKEEPEYYVHPYIQRRLLQLQKGLIISKGDERMYCNDHTEGDEVTKENCFCGKPDSKQGTDAFILSNTQTISKDSQWKQLSEARNTEVLDMAPEDELEGEILFLQNNLLENARANHSRSENLMLRVIMNLSEEQQALWQQRCDAFLVNDYLNQAREAKKQGRKERRHKEAQAILAAATAAAAASPRISSSRKDGIGDAVEEHSLRQVSFPSKRSHPDEWNNVKPAFSGIYSTSQPMKVSLQKHLKGNIAAGRPSSSSQTMLRAKETMSRPLVAKVPSERHFDAYQVPSGSPKEESLLCDICRLQESTRSNKIYVCRHCRVVVHQDCYGISRNTFGGWYCQPCEELHWQYQGMRLPAVVSHGRPGCGVKCGLCGGLSGAFKRTTDGQWVHVFCAEWVLENTFRRGQMELVEGLEILSRERYMLPCSICHRQGACLKCNFGHCQSVFHPLCARDSGFYMSVSTHGGRVQHKAYCEKHSSEQKLKAEARRCGGTEELKIIKQMRVELERLRLICERIVRREKLKRELLHCSHNMLASKRDCVAFSAVFHSSFLPPDVSSHVELVPGSATTSLRGNANEYAVECTTSGQSRDILRSQSEARHLTSTMDDILHGRINVDSCVIVGESGRARRPLAYLANSGGDDDRDDAHKRPRKSRKHPETLQREVVMTPTEASMQNQRLPKGYAYVPVVYLAKGKTTHQDVGPQDT